MTIETKFNPGDMVITMHNDEIKKLLVRRVSYINSQIYYDVVIRQSDSMGSEKVEQKQEHQCFKDVDEMAAILKERGL